MPPRASIMEKYNLAFEPLRSLHSIKCRGSWTSNKGYNNLGDGGISFSGHSLRYDSQHHITSLAEEHEGVNHQKFFDNSISDVDSHKSLFQVSAHGGCLTYLEAERRVIVIEYYE